MAGITKAAMPMAARRKKLSAFKKACILTAAIFVLTHLPGWLVPFQLRQGGGDKLPHAVLYGLLATMFLYGIFPPPRPDSPFARHKMAKPWTLGKLALIIALVAVIGCADELTQPLTGRTCSVRDWLANMVGIVVILGFVGWKRTSLRLRD